MQQAPKNTWDRVLGRIQSKVSAYSYDTWFKPTRFVDEDGSTVRVRVPNNWYADWLRSNYSELIDSALRETNRGGCTVDFRAENPDAVLIRQPPPVPQAETAPPASDASSRPAGLNPRYTFDSFVVSSCNQFAHAAAMAVAEQPSRTYNPLYLYGGVGLGKTHLMQAIGNHVAKGLRMQYISSEHFINEMINAIRFEKTLEFKGRYRSVDLLMIDDIQFLAGKERTQEEFFHTFNALYDAQKQIVITSDVPPRDIPTLAVRLRSRFECGLMADIQPPDLETKIAILRKKAGAENVVIPDAVSLFIASSCGSNVRELEGALIRVVAYSSISRREIDLELAREVLKDFLRPEAPAATVESIQMEVANRFDLKVRQLKSRTNSHRISFPRQIAMYLCKHLTSCSLQHIGEKFGGKHHSTVIHAIRKVQAKRKADPEFDRLVEEFVKSLQ